MLTESLCLFTLLDVNRRFIISSHHHSLQGFRFECFCFVVLFPVESFRLAWWNCLKFRSHWFVDGFLVSKCAFEHCGKCVHSLKKCVGTVCFRERGLRYALSAHMVRPNLLQLLHDMSVFSPQTCRRSRVCSGLQVDYYYWNI